MFSCVPMGRHKAFSTRKMQSIEPQSFDLDTHSQDTTKIAEIGAGTDSGVQIVVARTVF